MKLRLCGAIAGVLAGLHACACLSFAAPPAGFDATLTITDSTGTYVYNWTDDASAYGGGGATGYVDSVDSTAFVLPYGSTTWNEFVSPAANYGPFGVAVSDGEVAFGNAAVVDEGVDMDGGGTGGIATFQAVPEPAALGLVSPALLILLRRSKRSSCLT